MAVSVSQSKGTDMYSIVEWMYRCITAYVLRIHISVECVTDGSFAGITLEREDRKEK